MRCIKSRVLGQTTDNNLLHYCVDVGNKQFSKSIRATHALTVSLCALLLVGGMEPWTAIKCTFLAVLLSAPGVIFCRSLVETNVRDSFFNISVGCCMGLGVAATSQQLMLIFGFTFGWLAPQTFLVLRLIRKQAGSKSKISRFELEHLLLFLVTATLILSDTHWYFYLIALILFAASKLSNWIALIVMVPVSFLLKTFVLPVGWYLTTNDRLFDGPYAIFIHKFGYWSWYGAADVWIPYHWLTHGIAGIFINVLDVDPYLVTGVIVPVLSSIGIAILLVTVLSNFVSIDAAFSSALVVPLLGVIAAGTSISQDTSLVFGLAMMIVFSQSKGPNSSVWPVFVLQVLVTYLTFSAKVSTGIIAAAAIGVSGLLNLRNKAKRSNLEILNLFALSLGAAISLLTTFKILSNDVDLSSRGRVVPYFGGEIFASTTWASASTYVVVLFIFVAVLGSVGIFIFTNRLLSGSDRALKIDANFMSASAFIGASIFYGCVAYSSENYLSTGFWLAIPSVVGVVFSLTKSNASHQQTMIVVGLLGAPSGVLGYWMVQQSNVGNVFTVMRIIGRGGLQLSIGVAVVLVISLRIKHLPKILFVCIFLLVSLIGSDVYRISGLLSGNNVWNQGFEETKQQMFYGSTLEVEAKKWILSNTSEYAIIATNHICPLGESCSLDGETPIAAWTQRRTLIEAERFITGRRVDETLFKELSTRGHPDWVNERRDTAIRFANRPTKELLEKLKGWGVEWFWVDTNLTQNRSWAGFAMVGFSNAAVTVLKLS